MAPLMCIKLLTMEVIGAVVTFFLILLMSGFMIVGIAYTVEGGSDRIELFTEEPYCVTKTVNGKEFTRCLKAVEVESGK